MDSFADVLAIVAAASEAAPYDVAADDLPAAVECLFSCLPIDLVSSPAKIEEELWALESLLAADPEVVGFADELLAGMEFELKC